MKIASAQLLRVVHSAVAFANALALASLGILIAVEGLPEDGASVLAVLVCLISPSLTLPYLYLTRDSEETALRRAVEKSELRKRLRELEGQPSPEVHDLAGTKHLELLRVYIEKCQETMGATEMERVLATMDASGFPARLLLAEVNAARKARAK
jgi:hypothetical protein